MQNLSGLPDRRKGTYSWYIVWVLLAVSILSYVDRLILSFLIGPIKAELHLTDTQIGLITGLAFAVLYVVAGLPLGRLMDKANRSFVLAICVVVWSIGTACSGLASGFLALFLARVAVGTGEAGLSPAAVSLIGDYFSRDEAKRPLGVFTVGVYLGGGVALILGGELIAYLTSLHAIILPFLGRLSAWRAVFVVMGFPGLLLAAIVVMSVREPRSTRRSSAPATLKQTLAFGRRNQTLLLLTMSALVVYGFNAYGLLNWYPAMLMRTFRITTRVVAWTYGPAFLLGGTLGALSFAPVVKSLDRRGHPNAAFTVAGWTLAVITVATIAAPLMPTLAGAIFFSFITLFCSAMTVTAAYSIITSVVPAELRGMYTAAYMAVMNITGGAFGAVIVGLLTDYVVSASRLNLALVIMALVFGPTSVLLMILAGRHFRKHGAFATGLETQGDLNVGALDQPI